MKADMEMCANPITPLAPPAPPAPLAAPAPAASWRARTWAPYLFLAPFLLIFFAFGLFPPLFSLFLSFQRWDPAEGLASMHSVGLGNYAFVLTDPWFWKSVGNTVWMAAAAGIPQHVCALSLAFFIDRAIKRGKQVLLGLYFLPYITSSVAVALIFSTLLSRDFGVVNHVLAALATLPGLSLVLPHAAIDWLGSYGAIKPAVSLVIFWRYLGWNTVLYLAALQTIPQDLYEAAKLDGATAWQQFRHVSLPLVKPMAYFAVSMTVIGNLQIFEEPFILVGPNGGPAQAALSTAMYMYRSAFSFNDFGAATAMSWLMFIAIGAAALATRKLLGDERGIA